MLSSIPVPAVLLTSIVIAAGLIYAPYLVVAYGRFMAPGGYNPSAPRSMFDKLSPYAQRATWAHENALESFPIFAAAALMAYVTGQDSMTAMYGAIAYLVARLLYPVAYILDIPIMRSLMFGIANLGIITLFTLSLRSVF
ncbi:MAG: MAPEG family protein [Merismopedia sp. SIO2A8]|nr:MAPEG family protein [Merismopedia sp. SIO2A8]